MRALAYLAMIQLLPAGVAAADRQSTTVEGVRIDLEAKLPLALVPEASGVVVSAPDMPGIWLGAYGEACRPNGHELELPRPLGFFVADAPPAAPPWPREEAWAALCVEGDGVTLHVLVQGFDPVEDPAASAHVEEVLRSIVASIRPPIEIAPKVRVDRTKYGALVRRGGAPNELVFDGRVFEISLDLVSCRGLPPRPEGATRECKELADRAVVVTYRDAPAEAPAEVLAPTGEAPVPDPAPAPPPPPPPPPPPRTEHLEHDLVRAAMDAYGSADWIRYSNFRPGWGNGQLPLPKLPPGTWKLSDRGRTFVLYEIEARSHITVTRSSCAGFWASPPAGRRVMAPSFLPKDARAAIVDERERWVGASCFALFGAEVVVTIDLPHAPDEAAARALAAALTGVVGADRSLHAFALGATSDSFGVSFEAWFMGRRSGLAQLEVFDSGGAKGRHEPFRFALGLGLGIARPRLGAAIHMGLGIERPPMKQRDGEDHIGGSLFVDGRVVTGVGPLVAQGIARAAVYFDLDCTETEDEDELCGKSDRSDHTPRVGWEAEARIGFVPRSRGAIGRRYGGYAGLRYFATSTGDRVEHGGLATLGILVR